MVQEDVEPVVEIERLSWSPWTREQVTAEFSRRNGVCLVIADKNDNIPLGWCCAGMVNPEAELLKIAVHPDHRQGGLGSRLLQELNLLLCSQQVHTLFLEVRSQNRAAVSFYGKHGFQQVGERHEYYSNPKDDGLIFRKELLCQGGGLAAEEMEKDENDN